MTQTLVQYAADGAVARLTLDSPHNRNALSSTLVRQLRDGLTRLLRIPPYGRWCWVTPAEHSAPGRTFPGHRR